MPSVVGIDKVGPGLDCAGNNRSILEFDRARCLLNQFSARAGKMARELTAECHKAWQALRRFQSEIALNFLKHGARKAYLNIASIGVGE